MPPFQTGETYPQHIFWDQYITNAHPQSCTKLTVAYIEYVNLKNYRQCAETFHPTHKYCKPFNKKYLNLKVANSKMVYIIE